MNKRSRTLIVIFALFLCGFGLLQLLLPDAELSFSERRRLKQLPALSANALFSGDFSSSFEAYLNDQFPLRESFRGIKAVTEHKLLLRRDSGGLFAAGNGIYKLDYPLKPAQALLAAEKINAQIAAHPEAGSVYYSIVPDKSYFAAAQNGYPAMDYAALTGLMQENIPAQYIDLFSVLSLSDYYRTDTHWRQESLLPVAEALCVAMGAPSPSQQDFKKTYVGDFRGVLAAQSALPVKPDAMYVMESEATASAIVKSAEKDGSLPVYSPDLFTGMEPYDVFLSGAQAVMTIENPAAKADRELVIFRDSYGSSLTPLLIGSYSKITLVDLRYIMGSLVSDYVSFDDADVLFLYSTSLLNSGGVLR